MAFAPSVVDGRVLLLGLDEMYRARMKVHEAGELRLCAERVAAELSLVPGQDPVEGYYTESAELERYFKLMRQLQASPASLRPRVTALPEFVRLLQVVTSPVFGAPLDEGHLLPTAKDPLYRALEQLPPRDCSVPALAHLAHQAALAGGDISLVGLAALIEDPVVLTALRESVVLYAGLATLSLEFAGPEYVWDVSDELAERAGAFVRSFNDLFGDALPEPVPQNAALFYEAYDPDEVVGRCVRIAYDDSRQPPEHYHWAICRDRSGELIVDEFWHPELWTTDRYRTERGARLW